MSVSPRATRTMLPLCCSATRAVCLLPQSITLCRFVPLVWETSSQQLKCQLLVTGFHLSFEIKNSVVQKVKHCNDVTVLQPCTLHRPLDKLRLQSHGPRDELVTPGNLQSLRKNVYSPSGWWLVAAPAWNCLQRGLCLHQKHHCSSFSCYQIAMVAGLQHLLANHWTVS